MTIPPADVLAAFSVNQYLCPPDMPLTAFLDAAAAGGYGAVGLTERALDELSAPRLKAELSARGLQVSSWNSARDFLLSGTAFERRMTRNETLLEYARTLGCGVLNVIVGGCGELPPQEARAHVLERLSRFARRAGAAGVELVIEPMHPINIASKCCINTIAQATALAGEIGGLSLNLDLFHMWWDPDLQVLAQRRDWPLRLFQISDVAFDPQSHLPVRMPLGQGFVRWEALLRDICATHPEAFLELELFSGQVGGLALDRILSDSAARLAAALDGARSGG